MIKATTALINLTSNYQGNEPHVAENMLGFAAPGQPMQAHQSEVELDQFIDDAVPGELDGIIRGCSPGEPMQPNQGDVALENIAEQVMTGLEMPGEFFVWPEPYLIHLQHLPNGVWPELDLGGDFFRRPGRRSRRASTRSRHGGVGGRK